MIKKFHIQIPLALEDSFALLRKSGEDIKSWQTNKADPENGFILWKQLFWSLTGSAAITATLKQTKAKETSIEIEVHKPLQVLDPLKICDKVFRKLDRAVKKNLTTLENHAR